MWPLVNIPLTAMQHMLWFVAELITWFVPLLVFLSILFNCILLKCVVDLRQKYQNELSKYCGMYACSTTYVVIVHDVIDSSDNSGCRLSSLPFWQVYLDFYCGSIHQICARTKITAVLFTQQKTIYQPTWLTCMHIDNVVFVLCTHSMHNLLVRCLHVFRHIPLTY